ncbi:extracellular matrix protein [Rhizoctonia solani AG-3 Rhs1AP]|uniref:Extracellular matrix protein n=1 Tax=Rhizoctonia solani AG-3 Rhs1AP TaxID=1086054 RepID=X8J2D2_9AGAM|nr:extracellular matrix protein [Rhizoctonia solani AG-3 Rhs1AP]
MGSKGVSLCKLATFRVSIFIRVLLGENETVRKSVIWMWRFVKTNVEEHDMYIATDPVWSYVHNLARLTGNLAVKCENNQTWIARDCEPHMRYVVHFLTSWYYTEEIPDRSMAKAIARCLSNVVTENEETSRVIWTKYMSLPEKDNIITRLLQYPDRQTLIATLVFILNSLSTNPNQSLATATKSGGRAICVSLLEMADRVYENDQENDMLQLIFNIFIQLFEGGGLTPLYQSLQSQDGAISPHQITLLKLLDGYVDTKPAGYKDNTFLTFFLTTTLSTLLQTTKSWTTVDLSSEAEFSPNESLPLVSAATVLVSQMLSSTLMAEQTAWEKSTDKQVVGRPILNILQDPSNVFVELIIDVLYRLDKLLPRIQFGVAKPIVAGLS